MAIQVIPILKALAPLIAEASGMVIGLRSSNRTTKVDDRIDKLERDVLRAGEVLTGVAQQLQAIAQELRKHAELTDAMQRRARVTLIVSGAALVIGLSALVVALVR